MPDPVLVRYWGVPGWLWLWTLALVAFFVFGRRIAGYVCVLRCARGEDRFDRLGRRIWLVITNVLGQKRLLRDPAIGVAHLAIFWAFLVYAVSFGWNLLRGLAPALAWPYADDLGWAAALLEFFGGVGVAALAVAAVRRYAIKPERLEQSSDAGVILGLIAIVLISSLSALHFRAVGRVDAYLAAWWAHMIAVLGFLAYLPYSKHLHLLASPFSVFFGALERTAMPGPSEGAARLEEFTWRELLSGFACAECGRCDRVCPARADDFSSPKRLIHEIKELARRHYVLDGKPLVPDRVRPDEVWACATCYACMEVCPVWNEHVPIVIEMRRKLVSEGAVSAQLQGVLTNFGRYGNSAGAPARARAKWTQKLGFPIRDARKEQVDCLWFTGDYAAYDPRLLNATTAMARLLEQGEVDFGILYDGEHNSGNDVRRLGEEGLFETLRDQNLKELETARFERIITTDPHSYHALRNEYGHAWHVMHHTELLDGMLQTGLLEVRKKLDIRAVYHDPCYLGRYNGVYDAPRRVLEAIGVELIEMPRTKSESFCCGAGGGRIWTEEGRARGERPAENRVREAAAQPGVQVLAVSCPKDLVMFQDAVKTTGLEGRLRVREISELVEEACKPA